jgi:Zn-dependent peptidase ImmA (M78 family)
MTKSMYEKLKLINHYIDQTLPPMSVIKLANNLGIRVYEAAWPDNISGKIQKDTEKGGASGFAIFVNKDHPETRKRFTIAHEIAHYVLHENDIGDGIFDDALYRSGLTNRQEAEANGLAADILMPWKYLGPELTKNSADIDILANKFGVSSQAMSIRMGVFG